MREDTNFKGSDLSCPSIYFLFYAKRERRRKTSETCKTRHSLQNSAYSAFEFKFSGREVKKRNYYHCYWVVQLFQYRTQFVLIGSTLNIGNKSSYITQVRTNFKMF